MGIAHAWSDIDVALIYRDFSENLFQETIELMNLAADIDERIEPSPSYVFFCGSNEDRYTALTTNRLLQVIDVADQLGLISQLMTIENGLSCKAGFDPYPYRPVGTRTRIISGPMMGTEGVVKGRQCDWWW